MSDKRLFDVIESAQIAANLSVVAGLGPFLRALHESEAVISLLRQAEENGEVASKVFTRAVELSQLTIDPRWENPNDVALAAYLQVLSVASPDLATAAVEAVASARNCWWATKVAQGIASLGTSVDSDEHSDFVQQPWVEHVALQLHGSLDPYRLANRSTMAFYETTMSFGLALNLGIGRVALPRSFSVEPLTLSWSSEGLTDGRAVVSRSDTETLTESAVAA